VGEAECWRDRYFDKMAVTIGLGRLVFLHGAWGPVLPGGGRSTAAMGRTACFHWVRGDRRNGMFWFGIREPIQCLTIYDIAGFAACVTLREVGGTGMESRARAGG